MIIYDKIKTKYNKNEIYQLFPRITARNIIYERTTIKIGVLAKFVSFYFIGYSLQDYIEDYGADKIYKEVGYVFQILASGKNIGQIAAENGLTDNFDYMLKKGLNFNSEGINSYKIIDILKIEVDISKFKIDKYPIHIELFGEKEDLLQFQKKFKIEHDVLFEPIKKEWHLAFDGMLAEYLNKKII
ncbi:hypothetical protein [uncultured Fusobacterium sp.]|uniref:hypothetical protein n=1 Tax=uncultured Fusobacterium sp. TaxID=159267 RepID=UPI0027DD5D01|nr:hypothetical protein [uncultured Fusobacterium sp.]